MRAAATGAASVSPSPSRAGTVAFGDVRDVVALAPVPDESPARLR